jgi:peroxiredoxin (alkyl hydroperoxide reductase subunit C)
MIRRLPALLLSACALAATALGQAPAASPAPAPAQRPQAPPAPKPHLQVGDPAPDFTLPGTQGQQPFKLSDYRGKKNVVLAFFVLAFTGG